MAVVSIMYYEWQVRWMWGDLGLQLNVHLCGREVVAGASYMTSHHAQIFDYQTRIYHPK